LHQLEGLEPVGTADESTKSTFKGTLIHAALEAHGCGKDPFEIFSAMLADPTIKAIKEIEPDKSGSIAHLKELLSNYLIVYSSDELSTIKTERRMEMCLAPWLTYVGNVDRECLNAAGQIVISDYKTSSSLKSWVEPQVAVSDQFTGYLALAQANGIPTETLIVDGISTAKKALLDGVGLFVRYTANRTREQIEDWRNRTIAWAERLREDIESGRFNTNQPHSCTAYGGRCQFYEVCAAASSSSNLLRNCFEKTKNPWPSFKVIYEMDN
jgi:hypothetical protein